MAYSYTEYPGTGIAGPFSFSSILLLDADTEAVATQIKVYRDGVLQTITSQYTIAGSDVTLVGALYAPSIVRIARETKKDTRYINYVDGTNVTSNLLDLDSNQNFFLAQEAYDLQADAMIKGTDGQWAGEGVRVSNIASATAGTDAVNLNQLNAAVIGALPATLSGIGTTVYVGDGATTSFALPAAIATITEADDVEIYINGLRQRATTHYTLSGSNVVFSPAPLTTDTILMAFPQGVVSALLTENSVSTLNIQSDAVTAAKILPGTNGTVLAAVAGESAWTVLDASYISNFDTQVRTSRLDQMAVPTAAVSVSSQKITNVATCTADTDAANKLYVDSGAAQTSVHSAIPTGSTTSVTFTITGTYRVGAFTVMVPYSYGPSSLKGYFTFSGRCSGGYIENVSVAEPIRVSVPDHDAVGRTVYHCYFTRSGGSNNIMTFTVTFNASTGVGTAKALSTSRYALVDFSKGAS